MIRQKLSRVLQGLPSADSLSPSLLSQEVSRVTSDTSEVQPGSVFVAIRGGTHDGHDFIAKAVEAGAVLILAERQPEIKPTVPILVMPDTRLALARLAANFYGNPSHSMKLVGITGTSGKTTTAYLVESILQAGGYQVGLIGTVAFRYTVKGESKEFPQTHTTPGAVELQRLLYEMKEGGCTAVVMEVSSHALKQHRSDFIAFDAMVFTNLSPEHLDFHPDMEDYFASKSILFKEQARISVDAGKSPIAAINLDDPYGQRLLAELKEQESSRFQIAGFNVNLAKIKVDLKGIHGDMGGVKIESPLIGMFNGANILAAVTVTRGMGVHPGSISKGLTAIKFVRGRLESVPNSREIQILVDYAHKPDALEKVLTMLSVIKGQNRLITVVGCGGDRDRTKRPVMGAIAVKWSDVVFITSDNPRTEDPDAIIKEILSGVEGADNFEIEADRKKAIYRAIRAAGKGDIVLIAGKGHEDYQILSDPAHPGKTHKIHFDDREVADAALRSS